jgi:hypothetical protein
MQLGEYIRIKGKRPDWLDRQRGLTFPDYNALVVEVYLKPKLFHCCVMKSDGTLWNVLERHIIVDTCK